jgi:NADH-quinone oxidoreductase subunit G
MEPAHQPPAGLPRVRQGRGVPAAEPGDEPGRASPLRGVKRTFPKPINVSAQVLLDRERCVLCARCTRFSNEIAGDPSSPAGARCPAAGRHLREHPVRLLFLGQHRADLPGRCADQCPTTASGLAPSTWCPCPVCRALRERARDAHRCAPRQGACGDLPVTSRRSTRSGTATRAASPSRTPDDRHHLPAGARRGRGAAPASWPEALGWPPTGWPRPVPAGVLTGGRLTAEDAYAYAKFARVVLDTNDVDFRSRPLSAEETDFLGAHVVLNRPVEYADLDSASARRRGRDPGR